MTTAPTMQRRATPRVDQRFRIKVGAQWNLERMPACLFGSMGLPVRARGSGSQRLAWLSKLGGAGSHEAQSVGPRPRVFLQSRSAIGAAIEML